MYSGGSLCQCGSGHSGIWLYSPIHAHVFVCSDCKVLVCAGYSGLRASEFWPHLVDEDLPDV
jgi:hypothetical protein